VLPPTDRLGLLRREVWAEESATTRNKKRIMQKVLTVFIQLMSAAFDDGYSLKQRLERKAIVDVALTS
jgi:hypothetical protein